MALVRTLIARLKIPLILFAITVGFYWKLTLTDQYTWLSAPDFANQLMPWYQFQAGEWHAGRVPLWNPYEWAGQSLIGQAQPGVVDPLNILMYLAPLKNGWIRQETYHWFYVLGHFLAALAFYALCRSEGCSQVAAAAGGFGYSFAGIPGSMDWPQMFHASIWAPLALLFLFRAGRGADVVRNGILSGAFLGLAWLSGHHQVPLFFTYAALAFWTHFGVQAWRATRLETSERRRLTARIVAGALACMLVMAAVGAVQILPAYEYGKHAIRWAGAADALRWDQKVPYSVHDRYSLWPGSIVGLVVPTDVHYQPYLGVTLVFLAFLGAASAWNLASARWITALGLAGLVFAMGRNTPFQGFLYAIAPMVEKARVPAMALVLFDAAVCLLAAFAIDRLRESEWTARFGKVAGIAGGLAFLTLFVLYGQKFVGPESQQRWVFSALSAVAIWAICQARQHWTGAALAGLILFDAGLVTGSVWPNKLDPEHRSFVKPMAEYSDLVTFLRTRPNSPRIDYDDTAIPFNLGAWWGIEAFTAYTASASQSLFRHNVYAERTQQFLGVRYRVGNKPQRENQREVFASASGLKVYENPVAFGRLLMLHEVRQAANEKQAEELMQTASLDLEKTGFVIGTPPTLEQCGTEGSGDVLEFERRVPGRVRIRADAACKGLLVLTDVFDAGWQVTVDGNPARVWEANAMVLGVVVDKGKHVVEFRYRPRSVTVGFGLTVLGIVVALGAALSRLSRKHERGR